mmetsp:Transcript_77904/g.140575  ORF Transcript_77904/g.140575 Transcript_77904/m.140575 type:complete len:138 (-) Transcript_77904:1189-1602(-)
MGASRKLLLGAALVACSPSFAASSGVDATQDDSCDLAVVGAGIGGAFAAWQAAEAGKKVCVFELSNRPGGRIHSLREQGPKSRSLSLRSPSGLLAHGGLVRLHTDHRSFCEEAGSGFRCLRSGSEKLGQSVEEDCRC